MKKIKSALHVMVAFAISVALFSCSGHSATKNADSAKAPDSTAATKPTTDTSMAVPFDVLEVTHLVKDYAKWRPGFDSDSAARKNSGMQTAVVSKCIDTPNRIMVVLKISDVAKAKAFAADPRLKDVMTKNGVISKPDIEYFHAIRFNPNSHQKQWVIITHKVKDFDAWLKVYDGEGTAKRISNGEVDVVLARGIDDPNMVQVVFDITDMAKVKADIFSDAKKKLMMSAGVIGTPVIQFYEDANK